MATWWRDFRFGFRLLGKNKGFALVAVLALAVGIGPNTAIFSVIHATLLAPMPYPNPDELVMVWSKIQGTRNVVSAGDFLDWRRESRSFRGLWAWSGFRSNLGGPEGPEWVPGTQITPGFLNGIGVKPMLGRDFRPEEAEAGQNHVVILMHRLWQRRFGGRRDIIGLRIRMNGEPYTVVGVLPPGQQDRMSNQLWVPLTLKPEQINHDFHWLLVMGRMKHGVTIQQAQADMDSVTKHIAEIYPPNKGWSSSVEPLKNDFMPRETQTSLWMLMGGVGFVLLIACANVANLLLARGTVRQREIAVRASLGASRRQLFGQLVTESLGLALMGGVAGVGLGWGILKAVMAYMPPNTLPSEADVTLNLPVLLFTLGATVLVGILAGCAPAWQAARLDLNEILKQSGRALGSGRQWLRRALVVGEFAVALTLLAGAGLAIHSFWKLTRLDLGVRTDHILTFLSAGAAGATDQAGGDPQLLWTVAGPNPGRSRSRQRLGCDWGAASGDRFRHAVQSGGQAGGRSFGAARGGLADGDARILRDLRRPGGPGARDRRARRGGRRTSGDGGRGLRHGGI